MMDKKKQASSFRKRGNAQSKGDYKVIHSWTKEDEIRFNEILSKSDQLKEMIRGILVREQARSEDE